jgi:hypothetical protein
VILIDCSELSADEKLALASQVSDSLEGIAVALVKGENIVLDELSDEKKPDLPVVKDIAVDFISRRKGGSVYSVEVVGEQIIVHSTEQVEATTKKKTQNQLPTNLHQCPRCAFVTPYEELLVVHERAHYFGL